MDNNGITQNRRAQDSLLTELVLMVRDLDQKLNELSGSMRSHMHEHDSNQVHTESLLAELKSETKRAAEGFPNDDPHGHRVYHEKQIKDIAYRTEFWGKLLFELSKYGLLGFLGWSAMELWKAFLHGPK